MPDLDPSIDELVFEYLEAHERSEHEAAACLARLKESSADGGVALESAIQRLMETGLLDADAGTQRAIGPYTVLRRIARGGMGEVFLARPTAGGEEVAIKLLRRDLEDDPSSRARFQREVEIVRRLRHPSIASLLDAGEHGGLPYVVFERIDGVTLENAIRAVDGGTGGRSGSDMTLAFDDHILDTELYDGGWPTVVARIGREVARALAHAHARGVVHRDVKPSNVMITPTGRVVLLDFGLASLGDAERMTRSGHRVGSLPFMAPEAVRGESGATPAADVYSLGVTLFELATLRSPFEARDPDRLAVEILVGASRGAHRVDPTVPLELDRCIGCAMETAPVLRYATAEALASDLTEFLEGRPVRARSASLPRTFVRWSRRHPVRAAASFVGAFVVLAGPLIYAFAERQYADELERVNGELSVSLADETAAKESATAAADKALEAVSTQLRWFAMTGLDDIPGGTVLRNHLVSGAFDLLSRLDVQGPLADRAAFIEGELLRARGDLKARRYDRSGALEDYDADVEILEELLERSPGDGQLLHELGSLHGQRAIMLGALGRNREAIELFRVGEDLMLEAMATPYESLKLAPTLLTARAHRAAVLCDVGEFDRALEICDLAEAGPATSSDIEGEFLRDRILAMEYVGRAQVQRVRARVAAARGDHATAAAADELCLEHTDFVLGEMPHHLRARIFAGSASYSLARGAILQGEIGAATEHVDHAIGIWRSLAVDFPRWSGSAVDMLEGLSLRMHLASAVGDKETALALGRECIDGWRNANDIDVQLAGLATALNNFNGIAYAVAPDGLEILAEGEACATESIEIVESPGFVPSNIESLWMPRYGRAVTRAYMGDVEGARDDVEQMIERAGDAAEQPRFLRMTGDAWNEVLNAMIADDADAEACSAVKDLALDYIEAAVEAGYADRRELDTTPALETLRDDPRFLAVLERIGG